MYLDKQKITNISHNHQSSRDLVFGLWFGKREEDNAHTLKNANEQREKKHSTALPVTSPTK